MKRHQPWYIDLLILFAVLAALLIVWHSHVDAEWIQIPEFGGLVTVVTPSEVGIENARLMVGWYPQRGDLTQMTFEKRDTLLNTPPQSGVKFLAPYEPSDELLFSRAGELFRYSIDADASVPISSAIYDTCQTIANGDVVYYKGGDIARSHWLNRVLSENTPGQRGAINIQGTHYDTRMFLSDTAVLMLEDQVASSATDTIHWQVGFSGNTDRPLYHFRYGDTLSIIDGTNRTSYNGIEIGSMTWPLYSDSGTYDSIGLDVYGDAGEAIGDSLIVYGDFDDYTGGYFLWSDNTDSARGIPFLIAAHLSDGLASEHYCLIGDTSAFKQSGEADSLYDDHFNNSSNRYLIYMHGLGDFDTMSNYKVYDLIADRIDTLTIGDDGTHQFRAKIGAATFYGAGAPSWMYDTRALDAAIYRIEAGGYRHSNAASYSVRVTQVFGLDSLYITYWGRGTTGYTARWQTCGASGCYDINLLRLHRLPAVPFEPTTGQTALAYDICIPSPHRDRAWYAKDRTVGYSDLNDWYDVAGGGVVTFQKDVTALSSFGNEMVAHLGGNEIQIWTGYAEGDFYKVPAPAGVSAMNHGSLAHSDRDNADYFPHPLGLWKYVGGGVAEVPTAAREIFTDSVNWEASEQLVGAIFDNKYWFGYPQKPNTTNNRLALFDLEDGNVAFVNGIHPGSFYVRTDPEVGQQLWIGDADSAVIWLANSDVNEIVISSEMRSGWYFGNDRSLCKLVREYTVGYQAKRDDTLMVDFYTGAADATWSDTIVVSTGAGQTFGNTTTETTAQDITAQQIYGSVYTPATSGFLDSCRFYLDWTDLDGTDVCSVKVALYTYNDGSPVFVDSCYMERFAVGEADGEKTFTFSATNTQITAGTKYVLFMRATEIPADFTLQLKKDNTTGTMLTEDALYPSQPISGVWTLDFAHPLWSIVETSDYLQSYVYYSERVVQQHYAAVPRTVQGTALSYGLRSPSPDMRVIALAVDVVTLGKERSE